jgi:class 3 adenylate cyclase/streptogramin lyase
VPPSSIAGRGVLPQTIDVRRRPQAHERMLSTVMFTDMVGSTELASRLGDAKWRQLLSRHHSLVRKQLKRFGGREVDTAGDGFFATFDQPARAIACAQALTEAFDRQGLQIRVGIHMGEVEVVGPKVAGVAVHIGSRVMSMAGPNEIVVSSTVRDLVSGSDLEFQDKGLHELKGVPSQWHLYSLEPPTREAEMAEAAGLPRLEAETEERRLVTPVRIAVGAGLVVAVAAVTFFQLRGEGLPAPRVNTVAKIDPSSGGVLGAVPVGTTPTVLANGEGGLWVANFDDQTLQLIDLTSNTVGTARAITGAPTAIATGAGYVWVTSSFQGMLFRFDPKSAHGVVPITVGTGASGVAFGEGSVWVTNSQQDTLLRIEPRSHAVQQTVKLPKGSNPEGVAVGARAVWVTESLAGKVAQVDPESGRVTQVPLLHGQPSAVAFGEGYVWVTVPGDDSLTRIDPGSGQATTVDNVGDGPSGVAVGEGVVYVTNASSGTVARVSVETPKVLGQTKFASGLSPDGVAVAGDAVWVAVHAP